MVSEQTRQLQRDGAQTAERVGEGAVQGQEVPVIRDVRLFFAICFAKLTQLLCFHTKTEI